MRSGITSINTPPKMAAVDISAQLMDELRESFLTGGGTDEDWRDLVSRPNLPEWSIQWNELQMNTPKG